MRHIGLDVHTDKTMMAWVDDATGEVASRPYEVPTHKVAEVLAAMPGPQRVALEVSGVALFLARELKSLGLETLVVDAFKSSRLLEARHRAKTDRLDAQSLMECLVDGQLDNLTVWVADEQTQRLRNLTRTREDLLEHTNALRCQIRALLGREGERCPAGNLLGKRLSRRLDEIETRLVPETALCLREYRTSLQALRESMRRLEATIRESTRGHAAVQRLKTLFGCATLTAVTLVAEIGDITRFADARHLRSYAGVTPTVRQSGNRSVTGPLTKHGNPHLRRILVLLAQQFTRYLHGHDCPMARRYRRCKGRRGPNPAKVAMARDLCDLIFAMWRDEQDFDPARLGVVPPGVDPAEGGGRFAPPAPGRRSAGVPRAATAGA
jgi:transposase